MKITRAQLKQIIKEELGDYHPISDDDPLEGPAGELTRQIVDAVAPLGPAVDDETYIGETFNLDSDTAGGMLQMVIDAGNSIDSIRQDLKQRIRRHLDRMGVSAPGTEETDWTPEMQLRARHSPGFAAHTGPGEPPRRK